MSKAGGRQEGPSDGPRTSRKEERRDQVYYSVVRAFPPSDMQEYYSTHMKVEMYGPHARPEVESDQFI